MTELKVVLEYASLQIEDLAVVVFIGDEEHQVLSEVEGHHVGDQERKARQLHFFFNVKISFLLVQDLEVLLGNQFALVREDEAPAGLPEDLRFGQRVPEE